MTLNSNWLNDSIFFLSAVVTVNTQIDSGTIQSNTSAKSLVIFIV